jgi:hypothetical protein
MSHLPCAKSLAFLGLTGCCLAVQVQAQCSFTKDQSLRARDAAAGDRFGSSVALHGDLVLLGAPEDDDLFVGDGSAYLLQFDGQHWHEVQKLTASTAQHGAKFGSAVALSSDLAVVGSLYKASAYVFRHVGSQWIQHQRLTLPNGRGLDFFGSCVSLEGSRLLVGASSDHARGQNQGSATLFRRQGTNWAR